MHFIVLRGRVVFGVKGGWTFSLRTFSMNGSLKSTVDHEQVIRQTQLLIPRRTENTFNINLCLWHSGILFLTCSSLCNPNRTKWLISSLTHSYICYKFSPSIVYVDIVHQLVVSYVRCPCQRLIFNIVDNIAYVKKSEADLGRLVAGPIVEIVQRVKHREPVLTPKMFSFGERSRLTFFIVCLSF